MTPIDLRIKYKFETGHYPTEHYYNGEEFTDNYIKWLRDGYCLRNQYHVETGRYVWLCMEDLAVDYLSWLEEKNCEYES